jgi:hypothetical protein
MSQTLQDQPRSSDLNWMTTVCPLLNFGCFVGFPGAEIVGNRFPTSRAVAG